MLLALLIAFIPLLLWSLWRRSQEPEVAVKVTTAILVTFWGSFYINLLIPGTSPAANVEESPPTIGHTSLSQHDGSSHHYHSFSSGLLAISK